MLKKFIILYKGHKLAAIAHGFKEPTPLQLIKQMLADAIHRKTIVDKDAQAYIIYEKINKFTINITAYHVTSMFCPPSLRGRGVISNLMDKIPKDYPIIKEKGEESDELGRYYIRRA